MESTAMTDEKPGKHTSLTVKVIGYLIIVLVSFGILEIASYAYLRIFEGYDGQHLMTYEFDDYKNIRPTPNYHNTKGTHHNAQGFRRDQDTPMEKEPGTYRIFIMGGSTAYGLRSLSSHGKEKYPVIRNDETIDYYLEKFLGNKVADKKVEVINAAITSHYSHHHLIYLNQTILKYNPDMVIFIDGFNDYYPYGKGYDQFKAYAYQERAHLFMGEPNMNALSGYTGWWLFRKSHFVHLTGKTIRPIWLSIKNRGRERAYIDVESALDNLVVNAQGNFIKMVERNSLILEHEGVVPVFVLQPEIIFEQSKEFTELEELIYQEMNEHWQVNYSEFKNKAKPIVTRYLVNATAETGSVFYDMTDVFGTLNEDAYTDYCHLTPSGNKTLADELGARILPIIQANVN
jgi:lysophospholipase L1-like esterase